MIKNEVMNVDYKSIFEKIKPKIRNMSKDEVTEYFKYVHSYLIDFGENVEKNKRDRYFNVEGSNVPNEDLWLSLVLKNLKRASMRLQERSLYENIEEMLQHDIVSEKKQETILEIITLIGETFSLFATNILIPNILDKTIFDLNEVISVYEEKGLIKDEMSRILRKIRDQEFMEEIEQIVRLEPLYFIKKMSYVYEGSTKTYKFSKTPTAEIIHYFIFTHLLQRWSKKSDDFTRENIKQEMEDVLLAIINPDDEISYTIYEEYIKVIYS